MMLVKELNAIAELMDTLTQTVNPLNGSPIAVDATVIDSNGDYIGSIKIDGGEEYEFSPLR